jgi:microcystin-dependent protein
MTADGYSARVGFIKQATGNNNNNWGDIFNASVTDLLDRALWGIDTHAVTGGTLDLSVGTLPPLGPSPVAGGTQAFTGVLASTETVTFPSIAGRWTVFNNTTGNFSLLLKTSGMGTPIQIPQGKFVDVICDGTTLYRQDRDWVGRTYFYAGSVNQIGGLEMNGASLLRSDYPDLFAQISTTYGAADGTHFTLPNLYDTARFIRSRSAAVALASTQANQNAAHTHTVTGAPGNGSLSTDSQGSHSHTANVSDPQHHHAQTNAGTSGNTGGGGPFGNNFNSTNTNDAPTGISVSIVAAGAHSHNVTGIPGVGTLGTASSGGTEARPESIAMIACILY